MFKKNQSNAEKCQLHDTDYVDAFFVIMTTAVYVLNSNAIRVNNYSQYYFNP